MALATFLVVLGPQLLPEGVVRVAGGGRVAECVLQGPRRCWHAQHVLSNIISGPSAMRKIKLDEVEKGVSRRPHKGWTLELSDKEPAMGLSRGRAPWEGRVSADGGPEVCPGFEKRAGVMDLGGAGRPSLTVLLCPVWEEGTQGSNSRGWALNRTASSPQGEVGLCSLTQPV